MGNTLKVTNITQREDAQYLYIDFNLSPQIVLPNTSTTDAFQFMFANRTFTKGRRFDEKTWQAIFRKSDRDTRTRAASIMATEELLQISHQYEENIIYDKARGICPPIAGEALKRDITRDPIRPPTNTVAIARFDGTSSVPLQTGKGLTDETVKVKRTGLLSPKAKKLLLIQMLNDPSQFESVSQMMLWKAVLKRRG